MTFIQQWDGTLLEVGAPGSATAAGVFTAELTGAYAASAPHRAVSRHAAEAVPLTAAVDGQPTTDFDVAAVLPGQEPQWRPASVVDGHGCLLSDGLEPGGYRVLARHGSTVVTAGPLRVQ